MGIYTRALLVCLVALAMALDPGSLKAQTTQLSGVIASGGGDATGGSLTSRQTVGQRVAGPSIGGSLEHMHGFWNATAIPVPLPVELVGVTAVVDGRDVFVSWTTMSESGNAGFAIQTKRHTGGADREPTDDNDDGDDTWQDQGFVPGAGTTTAAQTYRYRIPSLEFGNYLLRLKQIDATGMVTYSDEIEVLVELSTAYLLGDVYPNPFDARAQFSVAVREEQNVTVVLYDILGRHVATLFDGPLTANQNHQIQLDGSRLASGSFLLRIEGEQFVETRSIMRVR
jgi:hypothetical protein